MSTSSPKAVAVRWFNEVWNDHSTEAIHELLAPDAKGHLEGGIEIVGPAPFVEFHKTLLETLPDLKVEILNALSDGDDACVLWEARATHSGPGMGLPPSDKPISFRGITWFHVVDGRITEGWDCWNQGGLIAALAGVPSPVAPLIGVISG
jgi:steroid delta-isomerase-like uncharacterized protein